MGRAGYRPRRFGPGVGWKRELTQQDGKGDGGGFGRRGAKAYQAALEAVLSIPVAGGLGYWADRQFGTAPVLLFVGLALGKETYSDYDMDDMRRLMPVQNGSAASNIADVCRGLLEERPR